MIIYEAPHHLLKTLKELSEVLGEGRSLTIAKELTKKHESFVKTTFAEAIKKYESEEPRGEYVLVVAGKPMEEKKAEAAAEWSSMTVEEHLRMYMDAGVDKKEAIKKVAADRNVPKRDIYKSSY